MKAEQSRMISTRIKAEREKIAQGNPTIELLGSCRVNNGIETLTKEQAQKFIELFEQVQNELKISCFTPSSGSGSRMFGSAYDFLNNENPSEETIEFIEHLINSIEDFAFYSKLPSSVKADLKAGTINLENFLKLLLNEDGFNFGNRPKGLIPFHRYGNFILNPFQEHILQGINTTGEHTHFHFTINPIFEKEIKHSVHILEEITGAKYTIEFSIQSEETNSIAFDTNGEVVYDAQGAVITRPSGHGALLENLNQLDADLILIRNIDNIQHQDFAPPSIQARKMLCGVLLEFQKAIFSVLALIDGGQDYRDELEKLNTTFHLQLAENLFGDIEAIKEILNRPIRVCGMVRNEGQPGGGPFWVKDHQGNFTRQIIEKSQISNKTSQLTLLIKSTHFNPVEIVCSPKNYKGEKFNLLNFRDDSHYFIVQKTHEGNPIQFVEQPGLWNGGMANWNTLFYEIENECFNPVKTVLDLLKPLHKGS